MFIHALWCHPRSVSTAFERIMRERGDLTVFHEPFMYSFYLTRTDRLFPNFRPDPNHPATYPDIRDWIMETATESTPVFFKDMGYYVADDLPSDAAFMEAASHAFLIRDPAEAILSLQARDPDFRREELGYAAQHTLYNALEAAGAAPLVITSDQLRQDPEGTLRRYWSHTGLPDAPHAFEWDDRVPDDWKAVEQWHDKVLKSGRISAPERASRDYAAEVAALGSPYTDYEAYHRPFFEDLRGIAERQLHQK